MNTILKVKKWGNSQGIRIPKNFVKVLGVDTNDEVELSINENEDSLILKKTTNQKVTMKKLFEGYEGNYNAEEIDWGERQGKEEW